MPKISIESIIDPIEVDLWGVVFTTRPLTKSLGRKFDEAQARLRDVDDDAEFGDALAAMGELFDLVLAPEEGKRKKASALLLEKWEADQLDPRQVNAVLDAILNAERDQRPT